MVDGILANPRNPVNHDLWLTGRFSTSRQPSLFLSLTAGVIYTYISFGFTYECMNWRLDAGLSMSEIVGLSHLLLGYTKTPHVEALVRELLHKNGRLVNKGFFFRLF